ncbi:hypothetical protein DAPPUDRAFT_112776 [Daphnia pulex]|uniref:CUB domain-containing protein n=1 Tax=Daphnia pulex TaxID=6669 RepID=E9HD11_DAPPU|nr:hypothetical protein DAPPUDRAFT_112776 [Daphnia pulex]|eukprot:EFX70294.1 hypothetical protein DAPPUDRAFT_112776 [Daphnia pulex]
MYHNHNVKVQPPEYRLHKTEQSGRSFTMVHDKACDNNNNDEQPPAIAREDSEDYFDKSHEILLDTWNYGKSLYYEPSALLSVYDGLYRHPEGRTLSNRHQPFINPFTNYFLSRRNYQVKNQHVESRFVLSNLLNTAFFNNRFSPANTFRPFGRLSVRQPLLDSCLTASGDSGICAPGSVCSLFGGRPSGSCSLGKTCCINAINTCGATVTLNNTYWQSPSVAVNAPTICALNIKLDNNFVEQLGKPICQIRLDFVSFTIAQPTGGTCTDTFQVGGATTVAPITCGDNSGQHMYLDVPSSDVTSTDVQLMFNFATGTATPSSRSWNIKISLLPCGADYLAPVDCLQYFTAPTGRVSSFNWRDVPVSAIRQLNNQNYNICFRTELIDRQGYCTYDYLGIGSATDSATGLMGDRFCGEKLNTARAPGFNSSIQLCTKSKPFKVTFVTDGTEAAVVAPALVMVPADTNNVGFCLDYQERAN